MAQVPVVGPTGRILQWIDAEFAEKLQGVRLIRSHRGRVVRVQKLPLTKQVVELIDKTGMHFEQHLPKTGRVVHALLGVIGSEREPAGHYCRRCIEVHHGPCPKAGRREADE